MTETKSAKKTPVKLDPLLEQVYYELDHLYHAARVEADGFWQELYDFQKKNPNKIETWWKHGCRVRAADVRSGRGLTIDWVFNSFYGPKGKRRVISEHISRGNNARYPESRFSRAVTEEERAAILEAESTFHEIRLRTENLLRARRWINAYLKQESRPRFQEYEPQLAKAPEPTQDGDY